MRERIGKTIMAGTVLAGAVLLLCFGVAVARPPEGKGPKPTPDPSATEDGYGKGRGKKSKDPTPTPSPSATPAPTPTPSPPQPSCGHTIDGAQTLATDLTGCASVGLRLVDGGLLDCGGHAITGLAGTYGVLIDGAVGAEVRNCRISGFEQGVRIRGGGANLVLWNELHANARYGIGLAAGTLGNRIEANDVHDNGDEGIHVGTAADGTIVLDNTIASNGLENLYLLACRDGTVSGNVISGGGSAAIYAKHVVNTHFADNRISDRPVQIRGESHGNLFERNELSGRGFKFEAYDDAALGCTHPRDNDVSGGSVLGAATCFVFSGAYDNQATGVGADGCDPMIERTSCGQESTGNFVDLAPAP